MRTKSEKEDNATKEYTLNTNKNPDGSYICKNCLKQASGFSIGFHDGKVCSMECHDELREKLRDPKLVELINCKINDLLYLMTKLEEIKPLYEKIDELTLELINMGISSRILENGDTFEIVDNFEEKNTVFRNVGVKRFEAKLVKPKVEKPKKAKKE